MTEGMVRICRNRLFMLVTDPDPRIYKDADERCPRCGTPWVRDQEKGQGDPDDESEE